MRFSASAGLMLLCAVPVLVLPGCAGGRSTNELVHDQKAAPGAGSVGGSGNESAAADPAIRMVAAAGPAEPAAFIVDIALCDAARQTVSGWTDAEWSQVFSVQAVPEHVPSFGDGLPPLAGVYRLSDLAIRFEPKFPIEPGMRYRASIDLSRLPASAPPSDPTGLKPDSRRLVAEFTVPRESVAPSTTVTAVFPTSEELPENQLKFYIHFSAPMSRGEAYQRIRLLDESGAEVKHPFLELDEELWDPSGTRFTLFLDPGRIKRGLRPREEVGPVFEEGHAYTLVLDGDWPDASGNPLRDGHRKHFRVGPPDERQPDPANWRIQAPAQGSRDAVELVFPEPLDHAMLHRVLAVRDPQDDWVPGAIEVDMEERRWRFVPQQPWPPGKHNVVVQTDLEDRAGNSIARIFDVDLLKPISRTIKSETVLVPFRVPSAGK